jgi:hypothetical protein
MTSHMPGGNPFTVRTETAMSEARNADVQIPPEIIMPETRQRDDILERGLLIGANSVPASSGKLADDVSPWDGDIYARVAAGTPDDITRAADAAQAAFPPGRGWGRSSGAKSS